MIVGVGTDLLDKERLRHLPISAPFFHKTFTEAEHKEAENRTSPLEHYSNLFAGKEAVFKAIKGDPDAARLSDIEILHDAMGAPVVTLHGAIASHAVAKGIDRIELSLSGETDYALAFAIAITKS